MVNSTERDESIEAENQAVESQTRREKPRKIGFQHFFWLRDQVKAGLLAPHFVGTENMPADILTKALDVARVVRCRTSMGLE